MSSRAASRAWAGPRSARSRAKTSTHCCGRPRRSRRPGARCCRAGRGSWRRTPRRRRWSRSRATWAGRRSRPGLRGRWWRRRARRARRAYSAGTIWSRPRSCRVTEPSPPTPVTVQVCRFATRRSGSLRRVATRSPTVSRLAARWWSPSGGLRSRGSTSVRCARIAALRAATCSRVSAMTRSPAAPSARESRCAFDVGGVDDDLTACEKCVEDLVASVALGRIRRLRLA